MDDWKNAGGVEELKHFVVPSFSKKSLKVNWDLLPMSLHCFGG
jgi:hypothetical protein